MARARGSGRGQGGTACGMPWRGKRVSSQRSVWPRGLRPLQPTAVARSSAQPNACTHGARASEPRCPASLRAQRRPRPARSSQRGAVASARCGQRRPSAALCYYVVYVLMFFTASLTTFNEPWVGSAPRARTAPPAAVAGVRSAAAPGPAAACGPHLPGGFAHDMAQMSHHVMRLGFNVTHSRHHGPVCTCVAATAVRG